MYISDLFLTYLTLLIILSRRTDLLSEAIGMIERVAKKSGFKVVAWRDVPTDSSILGELSADFVPVIKQIVLQPAEGSAQYRDVASLENVLYVVRREMQGYFRIMKANEG